MPGHEACDCREGHLAWSWEESETHYVLFGVSLRQKVDAAHIGELNQVDEHVGGFVSDPGAGSRIFQVAADSRIINPLRLGSKFATSAVKASARLRTECAPPQPRAAAKLAIDPDTCVLIATNLDEIRTDLAGVGVELLDDAYLFSSDSAHSRPWNPDWATHKVAEAAAAAEVKLDIKGGRH